MPNRRSNRPPDTRQSDPGANAWTPGEIDARFGLEPVYEPEADRAEQRALGEYVEIACPYCGETYGTQVDLTAASGAWIEDCSVCCKPIELRVECDEAGQLVAVTGERMD
jgi:hypothetical protein